MNQRLDGWGRIGDFPGDFGFSSYASISPAQGPDTDVRNLPRRRTFVDVFERARRISVARRGALNILVIDAATKDGDQLRSRAMNDVGNNDVIDVVHGQTELRNCLYHVALISDREAAVRVLNLPLRPSYAIVTDYQVGATLRRLGIPYVYVAEP